MAATASVSWRSSWPAGRHAWRACARGGRSTSFTAGLIRELERGELTWDVDELRRLAESAQDGDLANLRAALERRARASAWLPRAVG